ncbi:unnamed protein product [Ilex paraguariensis]|uniref:Protein SCAR n=1 Tax=Ilex paraguariensis TaxID=185542 RepID=A0ABC8S8Y5_9AQUA
MPLVRVEVRNEYGLGQRELYKEANGEEDPKAVLDGVAVAGLVGILRQLGDLAEMMKRAENWWLFEMTAMMLVLGRAILRMEQVMITSSRSRKVMVRVQHIEAALPPIERAILAQKSHIHLAYMTGSNWHAHVRAEENHFIYNDMPQFIIDSYEECRSPPCLHLLDKFDTGGPGSCLKRYSDPTFFKRASAKSIEAKVVKVRKDKKSCRIKKKRSLQRNEEVPHRVMPRYSGRMQFASLNVGEQMSPTQTVSTFDATLKSDLGDQSNSSDSRTGTGYIECVFHPNDSRKPEEHECRESSYSRLPMHHNETNYYVFLHEESGVVDDDIQNSLSQKQAGSSLSCVTWDEKTEIAESMGQQYDRDETSEMLPTDLDLTTQDTGAVNLGTIILLDLQSDNQNMPASIGGGDKLDDVGSEADNYMDALNTIESESEMDFDSQTKQELEQYSNLSDGEVQDGIQRRTAHYTGNHSSNFEPLFTIHSSPPKNKSGDISNPRSPESHASVQPSSNIGPFEDKSNSVSSEYDAHAPQIAVNSSTLFSFPDIELCGNANIPDGSNSESAVSELSSSGYIEANIQDPASDKIISSPRESQILSPKPSSSNVVSFWTNGSLLGLEPLKPPDFSSLNAGSHDSTAKSDDDNMGPSIQSNMLEGREPAGKDHILARSSRIIEEGLSSKCSSSCHNDKGNVVSIKRTTWRFSPANLNIELEKSTDFSNSFNHSQGHGFDETNILASVTEGPVGPYIQSTTASADNGKNSSRMLKLSNQLLVNGFRRKLSLGGDNNSEPASSMNIGVFEQKSSCQNALYQTSTRRTKEQFGSPSLVLSPSSSPPLQHMKISFRPIDSVETSKLKLKFPNGGNCCESSRDMFPSFQLVPELAIHRHDSGSDSDDDTFCRSSPYISDDCLSNQSESNSEHWESGEFPSNKDHELCDALCRISPAESASSSPNIGGKTQGGACDNCKFQSTFAENGVELSQSRCLLDLPSLEKMNPSFMQELKSSSDAEDLLEFCSPKEPMALPPPLPPLQWRALRPQSDVAEVEATYTLKSNVIIAVTVFSFSLPDLQRLNGQKETNRSDLQELNGQKEGMDEKQDFLHQIRTKSYSLRRTVTAKPTHIPTPPSNVSATAILEKANAIRQAVGSDDGEDEDKRSDI